MQNASLFQKYHFYTMYLTKSAKASMHEVGEKKQGRFNMHYS